MSFPEPVPGLVIRYSYLWLSEHRRGREEGVKDRPCAIVLITGVEPDRTVVVLPVTHKPPAQSKYAIEIPAAVKRRLGMDEVRSWVMLTEANRFTWPGPDLRPARQGDAGSLVYGPLPFKLFEQIREGFIQSLRERRATAVPRTE